MEKISIGTGNMKYILCFFAFAFLVGVFASCTTKNRISDIGDKLMSNVDKEIILDMIIDHQEIQNYLHPEVEGRIPLVIKCTDSLGTDLSIEKFGKPVKLFNSLNQIENSPYFEVISFEFDSKNALFEIDYAIEGITIKGVMEKKNSKWSFKDLEVFEN